MAGTVAESLFMTNVSVWVGKVERKEVTHGLYLANVIKLNGMCETIRYIFTDVFIKQLCKSLESCVLAMKDSQESDILSA